MQFRALIYVIILIISLGFCNAQQISVKVGNAIISENEYFTITLTINNGKLISYSNFPEIAGFEKYTTISNASVNSSQIVKPLIITQQYIPQKAGKFKLNDFIITVNSVIIPSKGMIITVKESESSIVQNSKEIEKTYIDKYSLPVEYWNYREPFLILNSSQPKVYIGEKFKVSLLFCIPEGVKTSLKFYELGEQLSDIIKKIKPENCKQEAISIDSVKQGSLISSNKKITYFELYESYFSPLNSQKVVFEPLMIQMQNKKQSSKDDDKKPILLKFFSKQLVVDVVKLPFHPLREVVPVGKFFLKEKISTTKLKTGKSFNYVFTIIGEGYDSQLPKPNWKLGSVFETFDPEIIKVKDNNGENLSFECSFNYFIIPHESGHYDLGKYFNYIYFNTETKKYDTLKSKLNVHVSGENSHNLGVSLNMGDSFYSLIESESNFFVNHSSKVVYVLLAKVFICLIILMLIVLIWRR